MAGALAAALAYAFLADGPWTERALVERGRDALGGRDRRLPRVVRAVLGAYHRRPSDRPRELAAFVDLQLRSRRGHPRHWRAFEQRMAPTRWPVARIDTLGDLAEWLELDAG